MRKYYLYIFAIINIQSYCQEKTIALNGNEKLTINYKNDKIENGYFVSGKFDWKIKILENTTIADAEYWKKISDEGIHRLNENTNAVNSTRTNLIGFQYNSQNTFTSSFTSLQNTTVTLAEHQKLFLNILEKGLNQIQGAKFEKTISEIQLGEYKFYRIKVEGYNTKNQVVLTQIYYNSIVRNSLFSVLVTYNDITKGKSLEENFIASLN